MIHDPFCSMIYLLNTVIFNSYMLNYQRISHYHIGKQHYYVLWITIATLNFPISMSYITGRIVSHMSHKISPDRGWFYIPITWSNNSFIIDKPITLVFFWLSIKSSWSRFNLCFSNIFPYISEDLDWKLHNLSTPGCLYIYIHIQT